MHLRTFLVGHVGIITAMLDSSIEINIDYELLNVPVNRNERLIGKTPGLATS